jgi:hypothetical protein
MKSSYTTSNFDTTSVANFFCQFEDIECEGILNGGYNVFFNLNNYLAI